MVILKSDIKFKYKRGSGPGGQHRNKIDSCVTATHIPTGLSVTIDGRKQGQNKRVAIKELQKLLDNSIEAKRLENRKSNRDFKIHNTKVVRTYNFKRSEVKDHRSGKTSPIGSFLDGKVDFSEFSRETRRTANNGELKNGS